MTLSLNDIAPLNPTTVVAFASPQGTSARPKKASSRRDFLSASLRLAMGVGVASIALLPPARRAWAGHGTWDIKPSGCNNLNYAQDDDCDGCDVHDSPACCCGSDGYFDASTCYRKHRPDECYDNVYDGWRWSTSECCQFNCNPNCTYRSSRKWLCTDGWKRDNCDLVYVSTDRRICRHVEDSGFCCLGC